HGHQLTLQEIEPGLYEFPTPQLPFYLLLSADGYIEGKLPDLKPGELSTELDIGLELSPILNGRVLASGKAVSKARLEALLQAPKGRSLTVNGFPSRMRAMAKVSGSTNEEGAFTLKLQGKEPVFVRCVAEGFAPKVVGPIDIAASNEPIEIALDVGGAIEGHVRAKDGTPVVGAIVGVTCGDAHPMTMISGHDGKFRFEGLSVGSWLVIESDEEVEAGTSEYTDPWPPAPIEWTCVVTSGQTTYHDLQLDH
ncbi:MAG: carboxypeptidase-like regulatory domain-containing protein, partial [Planctomycetota bacterium]